MVFPLKPPFSYGFYGFDVFNRGGSQPPGAETAALAPLAAAKPWMCIRMRINRRSRSFIAGRWEKNRSDRGYNHRDLTPMFVGKYTLVNIQKDIEQGHY